MMMMGVQIPMVFLGLAMRNIDINKVNLHNVKGRVIGNISKGDSSEETLGESSVAGSETGKPTGKAQVVDEKN